MNRSAAQPGRHREFILCGILGLIIAAVFGSTIYADFVQWDDDINIYGNPSVQGLTAQNLHWMFTDVQYVRRYMPLGWLSWAVDFELYGSNPAGYHLGNLICHFLNTILVFLVLRKLFTAGLGDKGEANPFWVALAGALFWAVHPLRVEPVAWASGRLYCQATGLLLLALFSYLKFNGGGGRRWRWYGLALGAYAASLLTYPIGLGLLPVLFILDYYPLRRCPGGWRGGMNRETRKVWAEKLPFLAIAGAMFGLTLWCRINSTGLFEPPVPIANFGIHSRIMQAFYVWSCYLWRTWLPIDLAPFYGTLTSFDPNDLRFLASASLIIGLSVLFVWQRRRWPGALALWLCYLVLLVPMLGLTEHPHDPNDRYSYLAGIAYAAGIAVLVQRWINAGHRRAPLIVAARTGDLPETPSPARPGVGEKRGKVVLGWRRHVRLGCASIVLALLAFLGFAQTRVWESSDTMFVHIIDTIGRHPRRADMYYRLGTYRLSVGNYGGAEEVFRQAIALQPQSILSRAQLGNAMAFQDKMREAVTIYEDVLAHAPAHRETRINLAHALAETGRGTEAEGHYRELLARWPQDGQIHLAYAKFLAGGDRLNEALVQYQETKKLLPKLDFVYTELGRIFIQQGETKQAIQTLEEALQKMPRAAGPLIALAWIYATSDDAGLRNAPEAVALAGRANRLTGGEHPSALDTLAAAYASDQRYAEAVKAAELALHAAAGSPREQGIRERLKLYAAGRPYREPGVIR